MITRMISIIILCFCELLIMVNSLLITRGTETFYLEQRRGCDDYIYIRKVAILNVRETITKYTYYRLSQRSSEKNVENPFLC